MKFCIIYYNTQQLTEALVKSINKYHNDSIIYIFDNSNITSFKNVFDNVIIFDNTNGQIINFDYELEKYPNRYQSLGRASNFGSFKHCISVQKCFELIDDEFILLDSDVLLTDKLNYLYDKNKLCCGKLEHKQIYGEKHGYAIHDRLDPCCCYINVPLCNQYNISFFNDNYMGGLYNPDKIADSWDTGSYFYNQCYITNQNLIKNIEINVIHFRGGSHRYTGLYENLTPNEWLKNMKNIIINKVLNFK